MDRGYITKIFYFLGTISVGISSSIIVNSISNGSLTGVSVKSLIIGIVGFLLLRMGMILSTKSSWWNPISVLLSIPLLYFVVDKWAVYFALLIAIISFIYEIIKAPGKLNFELFMINSGKASKITPVAILVFSLLYLFSSLSHPDISSVGNIISKLVIESSHDIGFGLLDYQKNQMQAYSYMFMKGYDTAINILQQSGDSRGVEILQMTRTAVYKQVNYTLMSYYSNLSSQDVNKMVESYVKSYLNKYQALVIGFMSFLIYIILDFERWLGEKIADFVLTLVIK